MIATLTGKVTEKNDATVVVECAGVGYGIYVTNQTSGTLQLGKDAKIYAYEYIKEEAHDLYGFVSVAEKGFFKKLLSVNGVGPKMALSIMNLGTYEDIANSIGSENIAFLTRASGVGRRLAERIVVDLKEAFADLALVTRVTAKTNDDALQALLSLGYSQQQAMEALADVDTKDTEEQIKQALRVLS